MCLMAMSREVLDSVLPKPVLAPARCDRVLSCVFGGASLLGFIALSTILLPIATGPDLDCALNLLPDAEDGLSGMLMARPDGVEGRLGAAVVGWGGVLAGGAIKDGLDDGVQDLAVGFTDKGAREVGVEGRKLLGAAGTVEGVSRIPVAAGTEEGVP